MSHMHMRRLLALAAGLQKQLGRTAAALLLLFSAPSSAADAIKILALGDSLTAGYGLNNPADAFPVQLEKALKAKGHNISVIQGGISGDTTTGPRQFSQFRTVTNVAYCHVTPLI